MAKCAKCSAELVGAAKFCISCGTPVAPAAGERAAPADVSVSIASPQTSAAQVNPFAATASPNSRASDEARAELAAAVANASSAYEKSKVESIAPPPTPSRPPPAEGAPSQISPLAVSNALSQRGAFQEAVEAAKEKARLSQPPPAAKKKPGTQVMQNAPVRPPAPSPAPPTAQPPEQPPAKKSVPRTMAMSFNPARPPGPGTNPGAPQSVAPGAMPPSGIAQPAPQSVVAPSHAVPSSAIGSAQPPSAIHAAPSSVVHGPGPQSQYGAPPYPSQVQPPAPAQPWGWSAQPQQYGYGFQGYAPGARVQVTWSNGARYPATVSQVSGTQCLVVFPDGQQHWVEMQYLSPA